MIAAAMTSCIVNSAYGSVLTYHFSGSVNHNSTTFSGIDVGDLATGWFAIESSTPQSYLAPAGNWAQYINAVVRFDVEIDGNVFSYNGEGSAVEVHNDEPSDMFFFSLWGLSSPSGVMGYAHVWPTIDPTGSLFSDTSLESVSRLGLSQDHGSYLASFHNMYFPSATPGTYDSIGISWTELHAVPEPKSITMWCILASVVIGALHRRRVWFIALSSTSLTTNLIRFPFLIMWHRRPGRPQ